MREGGGSHQAEMDLVIRFNFLLYFYKSISYNIKKKRLAQDLTVTSIFY